MAQASRLASDAEKSYRYLRLSIVIVVLSLFASILLERSHGRCWLGSISAYYYTPVRAVFVGGLVAIGVSLIAIKGRNVEDVLLNLAGVLAPIVAFVPTSPPGGACPSVPVAVDDVEPFIDNNVLALAIGGGLALVMAYVVARVKDTPTIAGLDTEAQIGVGAGVVMLVGGLFWYYRARENFLDHAHFGAAVAMFVAVGGAVVVNARRAVDATYRRVYWAVAAAMVVSALAVLAGKRFVDDEWRHQVFWLELLELAAFLVYWLAQTLEHWDDRTAEDVTVPDPGARAVGVHEAL